MRGLHSMLSTKEDYIYIKNNEPAGSWKPSWRALLDGLYAWQTIGSDESVDNYDESFVRVVAENEDTTVTQVWKIDQNCRLYRLGFSVDDVTIAIAE